jgi:hypothetical protein
MTLGQQIEYMAQHRTPNAVLFLRAVLRYETLPVCMRALDVVCMWS